MMKAKLGWTVVAGLLVLTMAACAEVTEAKHKANEPYTKEAIGESGLYRVTLTDSAVKRLDVKTALVERVAAVGGSARTVIPYAAIIYDLHGDTWTYTSPQPLLYIRERVHVDFIDGQRAVLSQGPRVGTAVVISGAAELYGIEFGLGK